MTDHDDIAWSTTDPVRWVGPRIADVEHPDGTVETIMLELHADGILTIIEADEDNDRLYLEQEAEIAAQRAADNDHDIWNCDCTVCTVERMEARR